MGWKDAARTARRFAESVRDELHAVETQAQARVASRHQAEAAEAAEADARRRAHLAGSPLGQIDLMVSGGEHGTLTTELPIEVRREGSMFVVRAEALDPLPCGSITVFSVSIGVPSCIGPGTYDLVDLHRRSESAEIDWWEPWDLHLMPHADPDDTTWWYDATAGHAEVVVADASVTFDLPMTSSVSQVRLRGTLAW